MAATSCAAPISPSTIAAGHPPYSVQDDLGVEGVIIMPDQKTKRVRIGTRKSSSRVKQGEHADGKDMDSAHQKNKQNLEVEVNSKDSKCH